jgi:hypothetical protein
VLQHPRLDVVQPRVVEALLHVLDKVRVHVKRKHPSPRADGTTQMHLEVARAGADIGDHMVIGEARRCHDQPGFLPLVAARLIEMCPLLGGAAVVVAMLCRGHHVRRVLPVKAAPPT